jgi:uncharacterized membrane protein YkvA (DUF1232 family)
MTKLTTKRFFLVAAIITLILPFDLIPDAIPVIGWLDDLASIIFVLKEVLEFFQKRRLVVNSSSSVRK